MKLTIVFGRPLGNANKKSSPSFDILFERNSTSSITVTLVNHLNFKKSIFQNVTDGWN